MNNNGIPLKILLNVNPKNLRRRNKSDETSFTNYQVRMKLRVSHERISKDLTLVNTFHFVYCDTERRDGKGEKG